MAVTVGINPTGPYDLNLCLRAATSYSPEPTQNLTVFKTPIFLEENLRVMEARQGQKDGPVTVEADGPAGKEELRRMAKWILNTGLDLRPFYRKAAKHPVLKKITEHLEGLKPMRPASLFWMGIIAVTEQQISLQAAHRIRKLLVKKFGGRIQDLPVFPEAVELAGADKEELKACGLSSRKAEYVLGFARAVKKGTLDLKSLKNKPDDQVREAITQLRGFGSWSADYILVRGLGRMDVVPSKDLGIRTVAGKVLGDGHRMSAEEVEQSLEFLEPYRGLAAYYLLTHRRLVK